jgi:glyoxylase-like metal-dependent hydrolase (beta-lactamase superfamily II)
VALGPFEAEVIAAPGHAIDQVAFHVRERGWLFSGDAYVVERVRVLRGDEDFAAALATLERLAALEVEALFCAHRPVYAGGGAALARKLAHLRRIESEVRELAARGMGRAAIARRLGSRATRGVELFSLGDVSSRNLVRSILDGPRPRREVAARLAAAGLAEPHGP